MFDRRRGSRLSQVTTQGRRQCGPSVSAVIVHWNTPECVAQCTAALREASVDVEILLVDNASRFAPSAETLARVDRTLASPRNEGFARAANRAAYVARGDVLLFVNPDTVVDRACVAELLRGLEGRSHCHLAAARGVDDRGRERPQGYRFLGPLNHVAESAGLGRRRSAARGSGPVGSGRVDWARASVLAIDRRLFLSVGGFDEGYGFYGEDEDLCWRLARRGCRTEVLQSAVALDRGGVATELRRDWARRALARAQRRFLVRRFGAGAASVHATLDRGVAWAKALLRPQGRAGARP